MGLLPMRSFKWPHKILKADGKLDQTSAISKKTIFSKLVNVTLKTSICRIERFNGHQVLGGLWRILVDKLALM